MALAALGAAVAVAVTATIWQPALLVLMIASIVVGAVCAWYAMTRRGPLRLVALLAALPGMGVAITLGLPVFLVLLALLVVFAAAGGVALGQDKQALLVCGCRARMVEPARHGVLLINPNSGGGKARRWNLPGQARQRGIRPVTLSVGDDLTELAERAVAAGADVIGMAGGDGSQALVAAVAMRHHIPFVCIPSGTRNHFALDLGLDRTDVLGALDGFTDGVERVVDLGCVNDRVFVNNASMGVYARVVQSDAYRNAKALTWTRMLPDMLGPGAAPMDLEFDGPDGTRYAGQPLVLVSNNPYRLARLARTVTRPRLDTGRLGVVVAQVQGAMSMATILHRSGGSPRFRGLNEWSLPGLEVRSGARVPIGLDGEALVLDPPLRFASLPGALRVRLPRHATGLVRATRRAALTRYDLIALLRVVAGRPAVARPGPRPVPAPAA